MPDELTGIASASSSSRLESLKKLYQHETEQGRVPERSREVNNHVHSCYSFSPYTPTQVAYQAWKAGLQAVGIMDHDSFAGAEELNKACRILGIGSTCGLELRVSADETSMKGRNLNNPGCKGIFYMVIHAISVRQAKAVEDFLHPIQQARNSRTQQQVQRLNALLKDHGLDAIDFKKDVYDCSMAASGGSITERHVLAAFARKLIHIYGAGPALVDTLHERLGVSLSPQVESYLHDSGNPHYLYDLLGVLKSQFLSAFFIRPDATECVPASYAVDFARSIGGIPAYAYLGDVMESPTGDKKAEKFEDDFLEELMMEMKRLGFMAVTFMPPRNTRAQLKRLMDLCDLHEFMQISGVDINSSRQTFTCPEILLPEFQHLNNSTWALIAHEKISDVKPSAGLFGPDTLADTHIPLKKRIDIYARFGTQLDTHNPDIHQLIHQEVKP